MLLITILFPILAGVGVSLPKLERRTRNLCYAAALLVTDALGVLSALSGAPLTLFRLVCAGQPRPLLPRAGADALHARGRLRFRVP